MKREEFLKYLDKQFEEIEALLKKKKLIKCFTALKIYTIQKIEALNLYFIGCENLTYNIHEVISSIIFSLPKFF